MASKVSGKDDEGLLSLPLSDFYYLSLLFVRRSILVVQSNPLRLRAKLIQKQVDDHAIVVGAYTSFAHRLKLKSLKQVCLFAKLSHNLSLLVTHHPFLESVVPLDKLPSEDLSTVLHKCLTCFLFLLRYYITLPH